MKEGSVQTDKTNPEVLKRKDLLFISIKYKRENKFRASTDVSLKQPFLKQLYQTR
jgi:hypothetical protein